MLPNTKSLTFGGGGRNACSVLAAGILFLAACTTTPQGREAKYMEKGKSAAARKNYHAAIVDFEVASQNMPRDAEPVYQLGMAYLSMGWASRAVEAFEKALRLNPKHPGAQYQMALVKVGSSRPELIQESKKVLTAFLAAHPGDVETMAPLALAEAKLGNKAQAWKLLAAVEEKNPANMRPATILIGYYAAKGDVATAQQITRQLTGQLPNSPDAAILRAQVSFAMRDFADTDAQVNRALALKSDFRPALQMRLRRALMNQDREAAEETSLELSKLPEKDSWGAYGRMLFAENKVDQGIVEFKRVLREHDDNALRHQFAGLLIGAGHNSEAEAVVDAALKKDPKDKAALLQKTTLEIDAGRLDDATRDAKTLQDIKAFPAQLSYQESRIFAARGESFKQGDLLAEALKYNPRLLVARIDLARLLTASGKPKNALALLEQATPTEQHAPRFVYCRDTALIASDNLDEARKSVDAQLAAGRSPGFLYLDAVLRIKAHDMPGARQSLEQSFQMMPDDPPTLRLLGECMSEQKEGLKFVEMLRQAAAKNPKSAILENTLGAQLLAQGDLQGARAAFEAAKAAGDVVDAGIEIATLDLRAGAVEQARQRLLDLIQTHDNARSRLLLAEVEARRGSPSDVVVAQYLKALSMEPANALVMNNLANALASNESKYDDALFWAQKAQGLAPANPMVEDTIGWIYYKQGKYEAALPCLEKSLKALDRAVAHYHLAGALLKAGDAARARKEYEIALREDPKSEARGAVGPLFEGGVGR